MILPTPFAAPRAQSLSRSAFTLMLLSCVLFAPLLGQGQGARINYDPSGGMISIGPSPGTAPVLSGPRNVLSAVGGLAALTVVANGSQPLTYQWFFNSNLVAGATGDSVMFTNVASINFGAYYAIVANAFGSATSSVARLDLDADKDGLADSWEITYFGSITNQSGAFDKDHDGTDNLTEYLDGTNPTNALSVLPRLTVTTYRCLH